METKFGGKLNHFYGPVVSDLKDVGKKSMEWDLNDWRWDGDLFMAAPLNTVPSDCRSRQLFPVGSNISVNNRASLNMVPSDCRSRQLFQVGSNIRVNSGASNGSQLWSDEVMLGSEQEKRDLEKRRRVFEVENEQVNEEAGSLNLKLGGQVYPITEGELDELEGKSGKKTKVTCAPSSHAVCQVEDCKADLTNAKDYHRRHKVCAMHAKATRALVGNIMQRFCQQCSRFHGLQEFDEGKRSCRRRLAGHNKRRRKTHPDNLVNAATQNDEQGSNYLLVSLLRILSNIHSNNSDQTKDQDLLSHLLRNLAPTGLTNEGNPARPSPVSEDLQNVGTSLATAVEDLITPAEPGVTIPTTALTQKRMLTDKALGEVTYSESTSQYALQFPANGSDSIKENTLDTTIGRTKMNNFDLNYVYDGSQDCMDNLPDASASEYLGNMSPAGPLWLYKDSQRSSPPQNRRNSGSTSSHSPSTSSGEAQSRTDRIVFKLFGKDPNDFPLVLRKQILDWLSNSPTDMESYIRPGCIILTIYLRMDKSSWEKLHCDLTSSLRRLVNSSSDSFWRTGWIFTRVQHHVTFVCNGEVVLDTPLPMKNHQSCRISSIKPIAVTVSEGVQFVVKGFNLSCSTSRLKTMASEAAFFFIVAEKDVCSEICTLESILEDADEDTNKLEVRNQALDFIHEMGWLLHRSRLKFRLGHSSGDVDFFPFKRFRWLIEFAVDRDWCAVVKKLISILFDGTVDLGQENSKLVALLDIGLLHRAVRRNCRSMVEFLLNCDPIVTLEKTGSRQKQPDGGRYLFRPDAMGPGGLTPLHVAASLDSCENVLDALTEDPRSVGIKAWKSKRDSSGLTAHDHACMRGNFSYVHLVEKKLNKKSGNGHVVVHIPGTVIDSSKLGMTSKFGGLESEKRGGECRQCEQKLGYGRRWRSSVRIYRPAMVSMVAIAAVCVCTALLFKSSPEVLYSFRPFRRGAHVFSAEAKLVPLSQLLVNNPGHDHKPNHHVMRRTWCIVKPSTSQEKLDDIIQYCCTQPNVDCKEIQAGGSCYRPPNKISDASVVMNIYYHLNGRQDFNCDFKGSGLSRSISETPPNHYILKIQSFSQLTKHKIDSYTSTVFEAGGYSDTAENGRRFHQMKPEWGFDKFIPHSAFNDSTNGYLVNDTCVFGAEVYVCQEKLIGKGSVSQ
ncbi:UNVERIFIED_CONTAM: Squamosa promoter-binding-like protein 1 [Sesamum radiatum]|uniref:Squamosa promoter-binding-like protein 1 n=1 Tax=Sesamum radiatum TaxID=300843 RepID=A0AAW2SA57_SESRA